VKTFRRSYARAADLVAQYYGLTPENEILIAQIRGNPWYMYKKAVKSLYKHLNSAGPEQFLIQEQIDFLLLRTDFNSWWLEFKEILNKC